MTQHLTRPASQGGLHHPSLLWPPAGQATGVLARSRRSQGPTNRRFLKLILQVQGGPETPEGSGSSTEVPGSHQPDGAETEACRESTFPERDSREADWLLSQPHTNFQGSWTGLFRLPGSGQEGILGSWGDTEEARNKGAPQKPGLTLRL